MESDRFLQVMEFIAFLMNLTKAGVHDIMKGFRFIVCDRDDAFCQKEKQLILAFYGKKHIAAEIDIFHSGREIIELGEKVSFYHAIFLEANMETVNGIDFGGWLKAAFPKLKIVLVSDDIGYAPDGYRVGAVRYIMKNEPQFSHSMAECLKYLLLKTHKKETAYIPIDGEKIRISVEKILYVDSEAHRVTYHLMENGDTETEYTVYGKLDDIEPSLAEFGFCRIHQSYLVNMNYVRDIRRYRADFLNGMEIPISKTRYKTAEEMFVKIRGTF